MEFELHGEAEMERSVGKCAPLLKSEMFPDYLCGTNFWASVHRTYFFCSFYSYIAASYNFMHFLQLCDITAGAGGEKEPPTILSHHNHYGPFHMGKRNFIILPAGTLKTKLMNTESFFSPLRC